MAKNSPLDYLMTHYTIVLSIYQQNDKKPKRTWENLLERLPELSTVMSASTFKQYISVFGSMLEELDKVREEKDEIGKALNACRAEKRSLKGNLQDQKRVLDKVRQKLKKAPKKPDRLGNGPLSVRQELDNSPKRVAGWNLRKSKDGYYRCYRRINSKLHSIYLGKIFDSNKAQSLIMEKERKIGLDRS